MTPDVAGGKTGDKSQSASDVTAGARILVVDDEEANRDSLARRLLRHGFIVETASDGFEALARVGDAVPDMILLDVMMPGMSGLDVLRTLRQTYTAADLPVVMATARSESEDVIAALEAGANDYVTKPLDFPVVLARVRTQVALRHAVKQVRDLERDAVRRNKELEAANASLETAAERSRRELGLAAKVQATFLPSRRLAIPGLSIAWAFNPSAGLAGDALNICPLSPTQVGLYVLDVAGHGVAASLVSVAATRALFAGPGSESMLLTPAGQVVPPADVAASLDRRFPFNQTTEQFLTFFYCVLDLEAHSLTYVSAGHPGAIHLMAGKPPALLEQSCMPIGLGNPFEQHVVSFVPGDRVYLYSDGVLEAPHPSAGQFGLPRLLDTIAKSLVLPLDQSIKRLLADLDSWRGGMPSPDDVTVLAAEFSVNLNSKACRPSGNPSR